MTPEVKVVEVDHERRAYTFEITVPLSMAVLMQGGQMTAEENLGECRHRARKFHQCHSCDLGIWPGYFYIRGRYVFDGRAYSLAFHEQCHKEVHRIDEAERQRNPFAPPVDAWQHAEYALANNAEEPESDREVSAEWLAWYADERNFQRPPTPPPKPSWKLPEQKEAK